MRRFLSITATLGLVTFALSLYAFSQVEPKQSPSLRRLSYPAP